MTLAVLQHTTNVIIKKKISLSHISSFVVTTPPDQFFVMPRTEVQRIKQ